LHTPPWLRGKVDSSDVVQESLLHAHRAKDQYRGTVDAQLHVWLRTILANKLNDAVRAWSRQRRDANLELSLQESLDRSSARLEGVLAGSDPSPSHCVSLAEQLVCLARALDSLPEEQRQAVELHHLKGCTVAETAALMGKTRPAVAGLLRRGLIVLRERLRSQDSRAGTSTSVT
jgi:RNA polymerase sigma-70 factor (ECF subfamily)